jgi:hypothetical protein
MLLHQILSGQFTIMGFPRRRLAPVSVVPRKSAASSEKYLLKALSRR